MENIHFQKYRELLKEITEQTKQLEQVHKKQMNCKNGCDLCCIDFSIFPLEYHFIINHIQNETLELEEHSDKNICKFLKSHSCTIYPFRPIMCRTHGLPLLYSNDEGEPELSVCHLNFTDFDFAEFTYDNTLAQDRFNSKLFLLNKDF